MHPEQHRLTPSSSIPLWSLAATSSRRTAGFIVVGKSIQPESPKRSFRNLFALRKSSSSYINIRGTIEKLATDPHDENSQQRHVQFDMAQNRVHEVSYQQQGAQGRQNGEENKKEQRRVRFDLAQNRIHEVSYQHGVPYQQNSEASHVGAGGVVVVSKSDLWWSSDDKHQNRARDEYLVYTDEHAMQYLAKASSLQEQTMAKVRVASRYLGIHDVEVEITQDMRDQVVVAAAASCPARGTATSTCGDSGCCYRGLEVFVGDRHEQEHRQREIRALLRHQEILQSDFVVLCNTTAEKLRRFSEEQSLKWRAVARQWGLVDAAAAASIAVER